MLQLGIELGLRKGWIGIGTGQKVRVRVRIRVKDMARVRDRFGLRFRLGVEG